MNYDFSKLTDPMKASILEVKRRARFIEGYNPYDELRIICNKYFSDIGHLESVGLRSVFVELQKWVYDNDAIGLILIGTDKSKFPHNYSTFVVNYTDQKYIKNKITIDSICQYLVLDYIGIKNVDKLCEKIPNYKDYLRYIRENSSFSL